MFGTDAVGPASTGWSGGQSTPVKLLRSFELAEKLLCHSTHATRGSCLAVWSKVLDHHREDGGEGGRDNRRGDSGFLCGLFDVAGTAKALLYLVGGGCSG